MLNDALDAWRALQPKEMVPELLRRYAAGQRTFRELHVDNAQNDGIVPFYPLQDKVFDGASLPGIDLRGVYLAAGSFKGCNLTGANFTYAALADANFSRSDVSQAGFMRTYLNVVRFDAATMFQTQLVDAWSRNCSFRDANMREVNLMHSHFVSADFTGAQLEDAHMGNTALLDVDLGPFCEAQIAHRFPSTIDFRSIVRSRHVRGVETFLVRSGMAEVAAVYLLDCAKSLSDSLLQQMLHSTFISYGGPDEAFAQRLAKDLARNGVTTFFFPDDAPYGQPLHRVMSDGVNEYDRVILICSEQSLERPGVLNEIEEILKREARTGGTSLLIPITLDDYVFTRWNPSRRDLKRHLGDLVVADFSDPSLYADRLQRLLKALVKRPL